VERKLFSRTILMIFAAFALIFQSCGQGSDVRNQKSDSGVTKATTTVTTDANGRTIEQEQIIERLKRDNEVGSIKHLYVISSYTGDVMEYSTVKGKVTSGGKRLSPKTVNGAPSTNQSGMDNYVSISGTRYTTNEVLDDGGSYGDSANYIYWFDANNAYHQYFPSGGTYIHISDVPLRVRKSNLTFSIAEAEK